MLRQLSNGRAVVVAKLVERSLLTPEVRCSNPTIHSNMSISTDSSLEKDQTKEKDSSLKILSDSRTLGKQAITELSLSNKI